MASDRCWKPMEKVRLQANVCGFELLAPRFPVAFHERHWVNVTVDIDRTTAGQKRCTLMEVCSKHQYDKVRGGTGSEGSCVCVREEKRQKESVEKQ